MDGSHLTIGQGDSLTFLAPVTLDGTGSTVEFLGAALAKAAASYTYDAATGKLDIFSAHGHLLADLTVHIPATGYGLLVIEAAGGPPAPYSGLYIAAHINGGVTPGGTLSEFTGVNGLGHCGDLASGQRFLDHHGQFG